MRRILYRPIVALPLCTALVLSAGSALADDALPDGIAAAAEAGVSQPIAQPSKSDLPAQQPSAATAPVPPAAASEAAWDDVTGSLAVGTALEPRDWAPDHPGAVPLEALPPLNAALKAVLDRSPPPTKGSGAAEQRKERDSIAFFYAARSFEPLWSKDGKPLASVPGLLRQLGHAADDALTLDAVPNSLDTTGSLDAIAASDIALTHAVVAYARQATGSRVDPQTISHLIGLKRELADPAETLETLSEAGSDSAAKLATLNPVDPRYVALRTKLAEMGTKAPAAKAFPPGPTLHVGIEDRRVPLLRAKLKLDEAALGDDPERYDDGVADAVAAFQHEHALPETGVLNQKTLAVLFGRTAVPSNADASIRATMEMWRWLPHRLTPDRVEVDVPRFEVVVFSNDTPVARHRVVVGKTETPTPLFSNAIKYMIVNPYWNVPQSIIRKEMLPKGDGDLSYLDGEGYSVAYRNHQWVVKQLPGERNALGRIKFLFPNDFSVYLHDTPSKALFASKFRAFSHGCVRVDKPFEFAESILNESDSTSAKRHWSAERLEDMIGDKEHYINLPTPLPIHIAYLTASVDPATQTLHISDDIYGYTRAVAASLGLQAGSIAVASSHPRVVVAERSRRPHTRRPAEDDTPDLIDDLDPR